MAETIRDVSVRVALEQVKSQIEVPGLTDVQKQFEATNKQIERIDKALEETSSTDAFVKAREETSKFAKTVADVNDEFRETQERIDALDAALEQAAQAGSRFSVDTAIGAVEVADKFKASGEGLFTLGRGVAFLTSSTDEGFQRMVQNIARIQGGFDLFKGSIDTIKGVTEGLRAMKIATGASSVATAIHAAVTTGFTTALAAARAAVIALTASLTTMTLAATAAVLAVIALVKAYQRFTKTVPKDLERIAEAMRDIADATDINLSGLDRAITQAERLRDATSDRAVIIRAIEEARKRSLEIAQTELTVNVINARADLAILKQRQDADKERLTANQQNVAIKERELDVAQRLLEAEKDQLRTAEERFGALDPEKQRELLRIARKAKADPESLNRQEASALQQFAPQLAGERLGQLGREAGAAEITGLELRDNVTERTEAVDNAQKEVQRAQDAEARIGAALDSLVDKVILALDKVENLEDSLRLNQQRRAAQGAGV